MHLPGPGPRHEGTQVPRAQSAARQDLDPLARRFDEPRKPRRVVGRAAPATRGQDPGHAQIRQRRERPLAIAQAIERAVEHGLGAGRHAHQPAYQDTIDRAARGEGAEHHSGRPGCQRRFGVARHDVLFQAAVDEAARPRADHHDERDQQAGVGGEEGAG